MSDQEKETSSAAGDLEKSDKEPPKDTEIETSEAKDEPETSKSPAEPGKTSEKRPLSDNDDDSAGSGSGSDPKDPDAAGNRRTSSRKKARVDYSEDKKNAAQAASEAESTKKVGSSRGVDVNKRTVTMYSYSWL